MDKNKRQHIAYKGVMVNQYSGTIVPLRAGLGVLAAPGGPIVYPSTGSGQAMLILYQILPIFQ